MSLCDSIDTLSMAYLDDELAAEERHELETHLTECAICRTHVDGERADHDLLQRALAAPSASDSMRIRLGRALDAEDVELSRANRRRWTRRWSSWALPGSAILAAAAAIALFVGVRPPSSEVGSVAQDAVRQQSRALPLEVQGASTGAWLRQNFAPTFEPPRFREPGSQLIGARLNWINGHEGTLLSYQVNLNGNPFVLSILVLRDIRGEELADGTEVKVGDRTMHVLETDGHTQVTYVDDNHMGYMFMAPELSVNELVWLVSRTNVGGLPQ